MNTLAKLLVAAMMMSASAAHAGKYLQRVDSAPKKASAKAKGKSKKAKTAKSSAADIKAPEEKSTLSRDMVFTGTDVNGKYLAAGEANAIVETEKNLNKLIGQRKDFKDRLAVEKARLSSVPDAGSGK